MTRQGVGKWFELRPIGNKGHSRGCVGELSTLCENVRSRILTILLLTHMLQCKVHIHTSLTNLAASQRSTLASIARLKGLVQCAIEKQRIVRYLLILL